MTHKRKIFIAGAVAAAIGLAFIFAAGAFLRAIPYPPAVLASLIVKSTPGDLSTAMIERFGHNALRGLIVGIHVAMVALGGYLALVIRLPGDPRSRARRALAAALVFWLAAVGLLFAAPEGSSIASPFIYLAALLMTARVSLGDRLSRAFEPRLRSQETPLDAMQRSRRRFITRALAATGGLIIGGALLVRFLASRAPMDIDIAMADLPFQPPPEDPGFPKVTGLSPEITSNEDFYTVDINVVKPSVDHTTWSLGINGLIEEPYSLTYRSLQSDFEVVEMAHTLTCISNEVGGDLISTAIWRGVRLKDVLDRGRLKEGVVDIVFQAVEGYSDSIPLAKAIEPTTLVVFGMNGEALPREHGFPARIIVPGIYGMKNVKWLKEIEAVDRDYRGYWMVRGWSDVATIKTQSRIDTPIERADAGTKVAGVAWAGDRQVSRVEISEDGGRNWQQALLKRELSPLTWRLWAADLAARQGKRRIMVRSTDGRDQVQTTARTAPHPDGAAGLHSVEIEIT